MEEEDLLIALDNIEKTLNSVNSAREQVENTVNTYKNVGVKFTAYTNNLKTVSDSISSLIEIIKKDRTAFAVDIDKSTNDKIKRLDNEIIKFKNAVSPLLEEYKKAMNSAARESTDNFKDSCSTALVQFNNSCNATTTKVATITGKTTDDFQKKIDSLAAVAKTTTDNLNYTLDCLKDFQKEIIANIKSQIKPVDEKTAGIQTSINNIDSKLTGLQVSINNLGTKLGITQDSINKLNKNLTTLSKKTSSISSSQNDMNQEIELNKKLNIAVIIILIIIFLKLFFG